MGPLQEPRDALEIFTVRMPMLFDSMLTDPSLLLCVRRLLDTKREDVNRMPVLMDVSRGFAETLISFLVREKLDSLKVWPTGLECPQCPLCLIVVVSTFMTGNPTLSPILHGVALVLGRSYCEAYEALVVAAGTGLRSIQSMYLYDNFMRRFASEF